MLRQKLALFVLTTLVFMGGAVLLYGQQTGSLTILADATALSGNVSIDQPIDLQKGVTAGNGNAHLVEGGIELEQAVPALPGTVQFDIGNPEVTQFQRFRSLQSEPLAPGTSISLAFAGSLDGISFRSFGDPISLMPSQTIDLRTIVPSGSHYLRLLATLKTTVSGSSPRFGGYSLDYEVLGPPSASSFDVSADAAPNLAEVTTVTVNGTLAGSSDADAGNSTRRAATKQLAGTGINPWIIVLVGLWLATSLGVWLLPKPTSSSRAR